MRQLTNRGVRAVALISAAAFLIAGCQWDGGEPDLSLYVVGGSVLLHGSIYDFGEAEEGQTLTRTFRIRNDGKAKLNVDSIAIDARDSCFHFNSPYNAPYTVDPNGGEWTFDVQFCPDTAGNMTAVLAIRSDLPGNDRFVVNLQGAATATEPEPEPEPEPLAPPVWIQGSWSDESSINNYTFIVDNVTANLAGMPIDFRQYNVDYTDLGFFYRDSEPSGTQYRIQLWSGGGVTQTLDFVQTSASTLNYQVDSLPTIELTKN